MNKHAIFAAVLCATMGSGIAKTSTPAPESNPPNNMVLFAAYPRVMVFDRDHHGIDTTGNILVCLPPGQAVRDNYGSAPPCYDANKQNAWVYATSALPGYKLKAYEFRYVGSGGYRSLILYFGEK